MHNFIYLHTYCTLKTMQNTKVLFPPSLLHGSKHVEFLIVINIRRLKNDRKFCFNWQIITYKFGWSYKYYTLLRFRQSEYSFFQNNIRVSRKYRKFYSHETVWPPCVADKRNTENSKWQSLCSKLISVKQYQSLTQNTTKYGNTLIRFRLNGIC
jgi:hypothetical protein